MAGSAGRCSTYMKEMSNRTCGLQVWRQIRIIKNRYKANFEAYKIRRNIG